MKPNQLKFAPVLGALALASLMTPNAHAGCGQFQVRHSSLQLSPQHQTGSAYLLRAAFLDQDSAAAQEVTIVGTWKEQWISQGSPGIPDGAEVDAGYSQWHSDGTEENLSGMRAPLTGDVCYGVWKKTGPSTYRMNHFGIGYDPTGQTLVGPAHIQQWLTLSGDGMTTSGKFTIDQYDEAGNLLAHVQGTIAGKRVTIDTGFEPVE